MPLTLKQIENASPKIKPYKLADSGGLCLLVNPSGAKLWRWRYRYAGKEKMMALGEFPIVTLKDVRERHFEAKRTLSSGIDPMAERKVACPIFCAVGRVSVAQLFLSSSSRRRGCGEVGSA